MQVRPSLFLLRVGQLFVYCSRAWGIRNFSVVLIVIIISHAHLRTSCACCTTSHTQQTHRARLRFPAAVPLKWTAAFVKPGNPSNPTPIPASVVHHAAVIGELCSRARATAARVLGDGEGEVQLMRLRTKYHELLIAPSQECTLVVSQRAHSAVFEPLVRLSARSQA